MSKFLGERLDLIEGLTYEIRRRQEAMKDYEKRTLSADEVGRVTALQFYISKAEQALESEDPVQMLRTYKRLIEMEVK